MFCGVVDGFWQILLHFVRGVIAFTAVRGCCFRKSPFGRPPLSQAEPDSSPKGEPFLLITGFVLLLASPLGEVARGSVTERGSGALSEGLDCLILRLRGCNNLASPSKGRWVWRSVERSHTRRGVFSRGLLIV